MLGFLFPLIERRGRAIVEKAATPNAFKKSRLFVVFVTTFFLIDIYSISIDKSCKNSFCLRAQKRLQHYYAQQFPSKSHGTQE
jgi:hypothetical protein